MLWRYWNLLAVEGIDALLLDWIVSLFRFLGKWYIYFREIIKENEEVETSFRIKLDTFIWTMSRTTKTGSELEPDSEQFVQYGFGPKSTTMNFLGEESLHSMVGSQSGITSFTLHYIEWSIISKQDMKFNPLAIFNLLKR